MKYLFYLTALVVFTLLALPAHAHTTIASAHDHDNIISAYRSYRDVPNVSISVPTVVEVLFDEDFIERFDFAVLDTTTNQFEPSFFRSETSISQVPITARTNPYNQDAHTMTDGNIQTYAEFAVPEDAQGRIQVTLTGTSPITSSTLTTLLDNHVALPNFVEIRALVGNQQKIVLANTRMQQHTIRFPETASMSWTIMYTFTQPLRITELRLLQENARRAASPSLRFLAQPGHAYRIYFDPDRQAKPSVGEAGNLAAAEDVRQLLGLQTMNNPQYVIADIDRDGVPDVTDNCISTPNSDQLDVNKNNRGDVCDDFDQDGLINIQDNCPDNPNRNQRDTDRDGIGDACDSQESRITERYPWIPWLGIGFAAAVLIALFALTIRSSLRSNSQPHNKTGQS